MKVAIGIPPFNEEKNIGKYLFNDYIKFRDNLQLNSCLNESN